MKEVLAIVVALSCSWAVNAQSTGGKAKRDHKKAIADFRRLAKATFSGDQDEIEKVFNECFQFGDRVADFGDLFDGATRREKTTLRNLKDVVRYTWEIKRGKETVMLLHVYAGQDPAVVLMTRCLLTW